MKVIVLGCNTIGKALATQLSTEGHDVTLVDEDNESLLTLQEHLDIKVVCGKPTYPDILTAADGENTDIIIAVTSSDEENMLACQIADSLYHIKMKIVCIRSHNYILNSKIFGNGGLPINVFINPEYLIADEVYQLIQHVGCLRVLDFLGGQLKLALTRVSTDTEYVHKSINTMQRQLGMHTKIIAVYRKNQLIYPGDKPILERGDEVYYMTPADKLDKVTALISGEKIKYRQIMLAGGNQAAVYLIQRLHNDYSIKIIEYDLDVCHELARQFPNITVLHGDPADSELLIEEGIENIDLFIALTADDEDNLVASLQAKHLGAKHIITQVNRLNYLNIIERSGVDVALSPRQMVVDSIFAYVNQGDFVRAYSLPHSNAEVIEGVVMASPGDSKVIGHTLAEIKLPKQIQICALIRGDNIMPLSGKTKLEINDHLVVFLGNKSDISYLDELFIHH